MIAVMLMIVVMVIMFVAVIVRMAVHGFSKLAIDEHVYLDGADAAAVDGVNLKLSTDGEGRGGLPQQVRRDAGIEERAEQHVAADAGKAFEVSDSHYLARSRTSTGRTSFIAPER